MYVYRAIWDLTVLVLVGIVVVYSPMAGAATSAPNVGSAATQCDSTSGVGCGANNDECDIYPGTDCSTISSGLINGAIAQMSPTQLPAIVGARSEASTSAALPIDVWGYCYYVDNTTSNSIFLPFRQPVEWDSFIANKPTGINLIPCTRANNTITITPDTNPADALYCNNPSPASVTLKLPYRRGDGSIYPVSQLDGGVASPLVFTCIDKNTGTQWQETVTSSGLSYVAVQANPSPENSYSNQGWQLIQLKYSATQPPVPGTCNSATNGVAVAAAPTTNLCATGTATAISGSGPWNWTCNSIPAGGQSASCSAPLLVPVSGPVNGTCGAADGTAPVSIPTTNFCSSGTASAISGSGPWAWTCQGSNGGTSSYCTTTTNCISLLGGSTCSSGGQAQVLFYQITPIPDPTAYDGETGNVNQISVADQLPQLKLFVNNIDVPEQAWTLGFPGYPQLQEWFGACYDGGYMAPQDGNYTFVTAVDNNIAIWIDGNLLFNNNNGTITPTVVNNMVNGSGPDALPFDGSGDPVPAPPVFLKAGLHDVEIKYLQAWPNTLANQVWVYPPGQTFTQTYFGTCGVTYGTTCPTPPDSYLMPLVAPPGGVINCPHQ